MRLIFELSKEGRMGASLPELDVPFKEGLIEDRFVSLDAELPEISEVDVVRHYTNLARRNFGVDNGFYPLGSCTMKYNPKVNEDISRFSGFTECHPLQPFSQGSLELIYRLERLLCEICGMDAFTLQPAAGAHGELTGLMMIKAYFEDKGEARKKIITTDSSHGTNPASASMCGFEVIQIKSNEDGLVDAALLDDALDKEVAAVMLTIPNTLGLFEKDIVKIAKAVHEYGSLLYMDGANMNALLGTVRPGEMGVDVMHLNLHKTFSTPHGGGGPGSGPVGVKKELAVFLPNPTVVSNDGAYEFSNNVKSIGRVRAFYGNFGVMVKAFSYIRALGRDGLRRVSESAVLNANYIKEALKKDFKLPYDSLCKHEFVISDEGLPNHVTTADIAKRLIDFGMHPMTIYFPLIVHGAMMIEPTETESKETLDNFILVMKQIRKEIDEDPSIVLSAPHNTPVKRLDAVKAARELDLRYQYPKKAIVERVVPSR
ncbi:MAG TPA: aminomethyl-transferring glycine dehydrogenase subunit GcvPB [Candidatus Nanoarchaeia archaeon]|nr:aminomethyl-transferring glycine dehydrogenase subunit GcvPB [Candidatus Nanoarchaeia archaeon]